MKVKWTWIHAPRGKAAAQSASSGSSIPGDTAYHLRRYVWRTILSITGPILLLGFYAFICLQYLSRPPQNDIVLSVYPDALGPFYAWFIVSIFTLDWARTALANFQA